MRPSIGSTSIQCQHIAKVRSHYRQSLPRSSTHTARDSCFSRVERFGFVILVHCPLTACCWLQETVPAKMPNSFSTLPAPLLPQLCARHREIQCFKFIMHHVTAGKYCSCYVFASSLIFVDLAGSAHKGRCGGATVTDSRAKIIRRAKFTVRTSLVVACGLSSRHWLLLISDTLPA